MFADINPIVALAVAAIGIPMLTVVLLLVDGTWFDVPKPIHGLLFVISGTILFCLSPVLFPAYVIAWNLVSILSICLTLVIHLSICLCRPLIRSSKWVYHRLPEVPFLLGLPRYCSHVHSRCGSVTDAESRSLLVAGNCVASCQYNLGSRLCATCDSMIDSSALLVGTRWAWTWRSERHCHHTTVERLRQSSFRCALCQLLLLSLQAEYRSITYSVLNPLLPKYQIRIAESAQGTILRVISQGKEMSSLLASHKSRQHICDIDAMTVSPLTMEWALRRIEICQKKHKSCAIPSQANRHENGQFPRRLLDVGTGNDTVRLVATTSEMESRGYLALSYCWGGLAALRLCKSNLETLIQRTNPSNWDKTYRDAITITRMLGFRYLWVDALCIMQPEPGDGGAGQKDWAEHAPNMGHIYAHAVCVLSASAARNTRDGCILPKLASGGGFHVRWDG
ncbi:heterokaryon incompatibility protein-domain-containing protein [Stachybotrys elegans]|uniref:Heterokaryon incompatibility protein-domain-containing protein n=1 Tax=Stachybotrys elegans TaxID=80388 RepID=A0A8K0SGE9_9HYPO|nr:heterokaryon incompatibility protein-domain-containing protein [Stachybotrys elegans]